MPRLDQLPASTMPNKMDVKNAPIYDSLLAPSFKVKRFIGQQKERVANVQA